MEQLDSGEMHPDVLVEASGQCPICNMNLVPVKQQPEQTEDAEEQQLWTCGMHPDVIDPLLGRRSLNLSRWAHWLPTQYPFTQDLLPLVPAGTE